MSLSQPIMNLERTDNIPQESTFVVEMGDGAGTKAVTKETLTKEMGEALKVGNLEELQTEAKSSIVAAINEAAQSGSGGSAVDILDTKEEIEANTEPGKAAGAQAVKEMFSALNDNLQGFTPIINESTGEITGYKTTIGGADTVFPFSKLKTVVNVTSDVKPTEKITVTYDNELIAFIAINNTYNERHMFQLLSKTPVYVSTGHYTCETDKHSITINNISYYTEGTFTIYALIK